MMDRSATLTVRDLLAAGVDDRVTCFMPIGFAVEGTSGGIEAITRIRLEVYEEEAIFVLMGSRSTGKVVPHAVPDEADDLL